MSDPTEPEAAEPAVTVASVPPPPSPPLATEPPTSAKKMPRTWPQRLTIAAVFAMAIGSFGAAGALYRGPAGHRRSQHRAGDHRPVAGDRS
jgi:hypothetical protein